MVQDSRCGRFIAQPGSSDRQEKEQKEAAARQKRRRKFRKRKLQNCRIKKRSSICLNKHKPMRLRKRRGKSGKLSVSVQGIDRSESPGGRSDEVSACELCRYDGRRCQTLASLENRKKIEESFENKKRSLHDFFCFYFCGKWGYYLRM